MSMLTDELYVENISITQGCITHNTDIWIFGLEPWLVEEGIYGHNQGTHLSINALKEG